MLTPRQAAEAPKRGSRSPLSPTEVLESSTVRLILSALQCSVNNGDLKTKSATWLLYSLVCDFAHTHPIMLSIPLYSYAGG